MTWRIKHKPHPHTRIYNFRCLRCRKHDVYHCDRTGIYYSLCLSCLSLTQLGPFRPRLSPIGYDLPKNYKDEDLQ